MKKKLWPFRKVASDSVSFGSIKDLIDIEKALPRPPSPLYVSTKEEKTRGPRYEKPEIVYISRQPPRIITRIEVQNERVSRCEHSKLREAC